MKKYLFVSLLLLLAHAQVVKAEATDVSTKDNLVYVMPLTAAQGDKAVDLCFAMKNSVEIRGFQMKIYLPEGVTAAKTSNGKFQYKLNDARLPEGHEQQAGFSEHTDANGAYVLMTCNSQYNENFSVGDGLAFSFKVDIAEGMEPGEYPVILREMKLSETDITKYYESDNIEGTLTIEENDGSIVLDENSTEMPTAATGAKVKVKRTIKAGKWSTICLPFALTAEQIERDKSFGDGVTVQIADFTGYVPDTDDNDDIVSIKVNFTKVDNMEANHPYIIKVNKAVTQIVANNVDIEPEEEPVNAAIKRTRKAWSEMIGTYVADFTVPEQTLFLSGNNFVYSAGLTKMKAYRAYFDFYDVLTAVESAPSKFSMYFDDSEATGINGVPFNVTIDGAVYTVGGQLVGKDVDMNQLKKGVYIKDGKKFVVD